MMNEFKSAKESYENTPIPQELDARVQAGIREGKARYRARRGRTFRRWASAAACFCAVLAGLNLSPTVAKAAAGVPVLGGLFQILTFVDYDKTEDGIHYDVSVPRVEADSGLAEKVNAAVQERVDAHLAKARQDWDDYREAFFATGGTEEEWGGREMDVIIDYDIKSQSDSQVSFVVTFAEGDPLRGKLVAMVDVEGHPLAEGVAAGADERGNLLLEAPDGVRAVSFGEAHLV